MEPERLRIQGLEHYIQANGIEARRQDDEDRVNAESIQRVEQESKYQQHIHEQIFGESEDDESKVKEDRDRFLETFTKGSSITLLTAQGAIHDAPLYHLARTSDTIYTYVSSSQWSNIHENQRNELGNITFSLEQFDEPVVRMFLSVVTGEKSIKSITPTNLYIDCCHISHFLQCHEVLNDIVEILKESVDSNNCTALCILADQLQLHDLFEVALSHVIHRLDRIKDHEDWLEFPKSLQNQVLTMKNAIHSSLLCSGRGDGKIRMKKVFFHSSDEFLSVFSDSIRERKERLADAKLRQEEIIREREELNRRRRHDVIDPFSGDVEDAARKIQKQEARIQTLERFYKEQKEIFASNDSMFNGSFKM